MEINNLLELVKAVSQSSLSSFKYEENGVKISLQAERGQTVSVQQFAAEPVVQTAAPQGQDAAAAPAEVSGNYVNSPLVGTFYAAPAEDAPAYVAVGDKVAKGQTLAIVEAMKLMNEIECEIDGTIAEILVQNGEAVEYGQPLFRVV